MGVPSRVVSFAALALAVGACAPTARRPMLPSDEVSKEFLDQTREEFGKKQEMREHLYSIFYPIKVSNSELCGNARGHFGIIFMDSIAVSSNASTLQDYYLLRDYYGFDAYYPRAPIVIQVAPGSAGERAGFQTGDRIIKVDGHSMSNLALDAPIGIKRKGYSRVLLSYLLSKKAADTFSFQVLRGQDYLKIVSGRDTACDYSVRLSPSPELSAFTDGKTITVTERMMEFVETDDELALVLGHELAHCAEGHIASKSGNAIMAGSIRALLFSGKRSEKSIT